MSFKKVDGYVMLDFTGEINVQTVGQFKDYIYKALDSGEKNIVLDFKNVTYINNVGIGILKDFYKNVLANKGHLRIVGVNSKVKEIFDTLDLKAAIPELEYEDEAV